MLVEVFLLLTVYLAPYLLSPQLKEFCAQYQSQTIANMDKLAAVILKERLFNFPEGRDFDRVVVLRRFDQQSPRVSGIQGVQ